MGNTNYYITPLHWAAENNDFALVEMLLENGESIEALNSIDETVLQYAVRRRSTQEEMIQFLIKKGAKVNARQGRYQDTPLMLAARGGRPSIVKILLENGADRSLKNSQGFTAVDHLQSLDFPQKEEIIRLLKQ